MKDTGGSAFPTSPNKEDPRWAAARDGGMTLRQYAAIKLRVPNSGTEWLDEMILQSQRNELAAKAMTGLLSHPEQDYSPMGINVMLDVVKDSYTIANAMLSARGAT